LVSRRVAVSLRRIFLFMVMVLLAALWFVKQPVGADDWQPIDLSLVSHLSLPHSTLESRP